MMDDKTHFLLRLKGKDYCGRLEYWAIDMRDLAGIMEGESTAAAKYVVGGRDGRFEIIEDYAVGKNKYYTLGEQVTHKTLVDIIAGKVEGRYYDPDQTTYKLDGWPD